jgi:hypothetical protein
MNSGWSKKHSKADVKFSYALECCVYLLFPNARRRGNIEARVPMMSSRSGFHWPSPESLVMSQKVLTAGGVLLQQGALVETNPVAIDTFPAVGGSSVFRCHLLVGSVTHPFLPIARLSLGGEILSGLPSSICILPYCAVPRSAGHLSSVRAADQVVGAARCFQLGLAWTFLARHSVD